MSAKLPFHEWCVIILFCLILLTISTFALMGRKNAPSPPQPSRPRSTVIEVKIEGEVAKPGVYYLPLKSSLNELLLQAELLPTADLSQLNLRRKLRDGQIIHILPRTWITIQISGLVAQPGPMTILSGTRIYEIVDQIEALPEGDLKALSKRKSYLYEGDIIEVRPKKVKKPSKKKTGARKKKEV